MKREEYLKKCAEYILDLEKRVKILNSLNYYDINISSENFFVRLLGLVYGWSLENMNHKENNTSAIDLYDKVGRIAVQVTSDNSANKIHNTIEKYIKKDLQNDYDRLVFMVITEDKNYRATFNTKGIFEFDKKEDIITCKRLINDIEALDTEEIVEIYKYLSFEFDSVVNNESVWTIESAVKYMSDSTDGVLSLDYFEIDDIEFINNFNSAFDREDNIFVKGTSREETLYCVLNLIKKNNIKKAVYIVKNKETWNEFGKYIQDAILIPYFQDEEIAAIKGNINIFIYGIENHTIKNYIPLRRRKMRTLEEKLKDYKDGDHSLIVKTNGLFPFIKKRLFNGYTEELPYANSISKVVIAGLLIGQWTEIEGDKCIIEEVSGMTYSEFIQEIGRYMNVESPLFVKNTGWSGNTYKISDVVILWSKYYDNVTDEEKLVFYKIVEKVVLDKDPLFDIPFKDHMYGSIRAKKSTYSNALKKGVLQSLIFLAINGEQSSVDCCIRNILSCISDLNMWGYIAQFAEQICEASPSVFIEKVENSKDKEEFIDLFKSEGDSFTARHYYTHILWAMEQLLRLKEYAPRAVRLLMQLTTKIQKCAISNSPSEVLSVVFCSWLNLYSISLDDKIKLAEIGVKQYETMWKIIFDVIESRDRSIMVSRSTFDYRLSEDVEEVTYGDVYKVNMGYLNILRENAGKDISKWIKLIELFADVSDDVFIDLLNQLRIVIDKQDDADKEKIKTKLRKEIYRHRFFCKSNWAMKEERICEIEKVCTNIKFENSAYDFLYLVNSGYKFPLYNPNPLKDGRIEENEKLKEQVLREEFKRIKCESVDICEIISLSLENKYTQFGRYIAQYYSEGIFDECLYKKMLQINGIRDILKDYVVYTYHLNNNVFETALKLSVKYEGSNDLYVEILKIPEINKEYLKFICEQDNDIQKKYFSSVYFRSEKKPEWSGIFVKKCIEYNCAYTLLDFLHRTKKEFTLDELLEIISRVSEMLMQGNQIVHETFLLEDVIEYTQSLIKEDFDKYEEMCNLEIRFYKILSWDRMLCTQHLFKTDASLYAQLVEIILKKDSELANAEMSNDHKQKVLQYWWDFHYNAKFCPGEIGGKINEDILNKWIEDFEKLLSKQKQSRLFTGLLGALFAYSPIGDDGYYPHECIRNIIEERMDDSLKRSYVSAELNKRGVYTVDAGEGEKKLALNYKKNADSIRIEYPKTAEIYDKISRNYLAEANVERKRAEDGLW